MRILIAAYYELIKNIRDIKMALIMILAPILVIFLVGTSIGNLFSRDVEKTMQVGCVNLDEGAAGEAFGQFLEAKEIKKRLAVKKYTGADEARKAVDNGEIDAYIYLPADLSQNMLKGSKQAIQIYGKKQVEAVEAIVNGFASSFNTVNAVIMTAGKPAVPGVESGITGNVLQRVFLNKNTSVPRMIDYYSVLNLLQMLIMGSLLGVFIITKPDDSDINIRTYSLPISTQALILGRVIGSTAYLFVTSVFVIIFTGVVYGSNWRGNPVIILLTMLVFCMISVVIGVIAGLLVRSRSTGLMLSLLLMLFFGTISGAIMPSGSLDVINLLSPNYHAKVLLFGTIFGYSSQVMIEAALWLTGFLAVIFGAAGLLLRRVRYGNI